MVALTVLIAAIGVGLVLWKPPAFGLGIVLASTVLYPEFMRVPMGFSQMSVPRFIAAALVIKAYASGERFSWRWADSLVVGWWCWDVCANTIAGSSSVQIIWVIGRSLDTVLMYCAARIAIQRCSALATVVGPVLVATVIMSLMGIVEMLTHHSPYHAFESFYSWAHLGLGVEDDVRFGLLRARGSCGQPASFGLAIMILTGLVYASRRYARRGRLVIAATVLGFAGVASSLSSGPMVALMVLVLACMLFVAPRLIKPLLTVIVLTCVAAEFVSNRRFYYLTEYLNVFGGDYWYRCRLMDVAIQELPRYWVCGYGGHSYDYWGDLIDGRSYVDLVNEYIVIAISGGLAGLGLFVSAHFSALRALVRKYRALVNPKEKWLAYHLGALIVAVMVAGFQLTLLGAPNLLLFLLLGIAVSVGGHAWRKGSSPMTTRGLRRKRIRRARSQSEGSVAEYKANEGVEACGSARRIVGASALDSSGVCRRGRCGAVAADRVVSATGETRPAVHGWSAGDGSI